jgi:hypothetical protein
VLRGFGQNLLPFLELPCPSRTEGLRTCWRRIGPNVPRNQHCPATAKSQF